MSTAVCEVQRPGVQSIWSARDQPHLPLDATRPLVDVEQSLPVPAVAEDSCGCCQHGRLPITIDTAQS